MSYLDNAYGLRDLHETLLTMLKEIDRVCRKHQIDYTLVGGTMLGAIREGGFIPWDDDLDIAFRREELERFLKVFDAESEQYTTTTSDTWVARVVPRKPINGEMPFIDLFHYVPICTDPKKQKIKVFALKTLQGMLKEGISLKDYPPKYRILLWGTRMLGLPFSKPLKLRWYRHIAENWAPGDGTQVHVPDGDYRVLHRVYPAEWTRHFTDVDFEGIPMRVSAHYHEMLSRQYGNYMQRPSEDKRVVAHAAQRKGK